MTTLALTPDVVSRLRGKKVFLRADLNVPRKLDGTIAHPARIEALLPTLRLLLNAGARVAIASHLGRPGGAPNGQDSLAPVAERLRSYLSQPLFFASDCIGSEVSASVDKLPDGAAICLENLRFHPGEQGGEKAFARALAAPFEVYVNDAFGAAHRPHASIVGLPELFTDKHMGILMTREVNALTHLLDSPARPFVALVGGAKVRDKLPLLRSLLSRVDVLLLGGQMAFTFLSARGVPTGDTRVESSALGAAQALLEDARAKGVRIVLPQDHLSLLSTALKDPSAVPRLSEPGIDAGHVAVDIGPETALEFAALLRGARRVFWNGPVGIFEAARSRRGTLAVAQAVASCRGLTVVGGGDSLAALGDSCLQGQVTHCSTGGGASLAFIEKATLCGLTALGYRVGNTLAPNAHPAP